MPKYTFPLLIFLLVMVNKSYPQPAPSTLPNIVLFLIDDLGYAELGCQGNVDIPTPHIDDLAANGIRFTQAYVANSYCSPSRAGILTGRYPNRYNYLSNIVGHQNEDPNLGLPINEITIAEYLLEAGYYNGIFGKWHQGGTAKYHPFRQGFDEFFGFLHEGHYYVPPPYKGVTTMLRRKVLPGGGKGRWRAANKRTIYTTHMGHNEPDYDANNPILKASQPIAENTYLTDAITREAVDFINRNQDKPFFLYVAYNAVHSPLQGADAYMEKFAHIPDIHRRIFAAMLANVDDSVGAIMDLLKHLNLYEDTLVVFLSDNGGPTKELTSSNSPLKGGKGNYYEGGIRIPFIMQWPQVLPKGKTYTQPVIALDLLPTFAAAAQKPVKDLELDGVDLLPFLTQKQLGMPHQTLFWSFRDKMAWRNQDWKIVKNKKDQPIELYHLSHDSTEINNMADEYPEKVEQMRREWQTFLNKIMPE